MAVDIDDTRNAQLTIDEWKFIEGLVSKKVVRSGRWTTEAAVEGLWKDIKGVNDLFVKKIASEAQRIEKERAEKEKKDKENADQEKGEAAKGKQATSKPATSHGATPQKLKPILEEILGKHFKSLSRWATTGFFLLPLVS